MKAILCVLAYPVVVGGAYFALIAGLRAVGDKSSVVTAVCVAAALAVAVLERVIPYRAEWNRSKGDVVVDALYAAATGAVSEGARLTTALLPAVSALWPRGWPLAAQVALAFTLGELPGYWIHRIQHERGGWLWRLHAPHHSVPRMYWLNSARQHPIDSVLSTFLLFVLPVLMGAQEETLRLLGAIIVVHGLLQHSNVDARLGPFNWVLSMAEVHRWHHSRVVSEANGNYGQLSLVWDLVFGTRRVPRDREPPVDTGLNGMPSFPMDFLGQLASPFRQELWQPPL